jgi:hypothetical protein
VYHDEKKLRKLQHRLEKARDYFNGQGPDEAGLVEHLDASVGIINDLLTCTCEVFSSIDELMQCPLHGDTTSPERGTTR